PTRSVTQDSGLRTQDSFLYLDSLQGSGIRPGLARIRALLRALRRPERAYPSIIVAGTNGKGSTSATLASILNASGYRTAHYTSPHLVDIRERWVLGGAPIDDATLVESIERLRVAAARTGIEPTYFEALTIVAFIAFAIVKCDLAVLEVGMGGRLDATNVVRPIAALITPIGLDHTEYLGNTIRKIASEKAGVIHRGAIALTSDRDPVVIDVIRRRAAKFGTPLIVVDGEHGTPLRGKFQRRNAALAVRAAEELMERLPKITKESIERGVAETRWRGRLERMTIEGKDVWIDGGHNAHAARAIAEFIASDIAAPRTLVFGIMRDKDVREVVDILFPLFDEVIVTEPYPPRSLTVEELRELAPNVTAEREPKAAIERALHGGSRSVVIAGSLYLAGAAIEQLEQRRGHE
ncbi:MAG: FolC bifunctional protein, partial [Acidobacteria bacterium]|nr:FolC bifunctional protein [Acidobacteriota bacterium]